MAKQYNNDKHKPCTDKEFEAVCSMLELDDRGLRDICKDLDVHRTEFYLKINEDEKCWNRYARAKHRQCEPLFEKLDDIANEPLPTTAMGSLDGAAVQDKRVRIDNIKWKLSKIIPKKYGDKIDVSTNGESLNKPPVFILPSQKDIDNIQGVIERMDKDASLSCD